MSTQLNIKCQNQYTDLKDIVRIANKLKRKYTVKNKINLHAIMKDENIIFQDDETAKENNFELLDHENGKIFYYLDSSKIKHWIIVYRKNLKKDKLRFTIAHELGHYFLKHIQKWIEINGPLNVYDPKFEEEANQFAQAFLMICN